MKQQRAELTRTTIVEAAARMFDRQGFGSTSLADIVGESGVTKGALYFHFASKEQLARAVVGLQHEQAMNAADRLLSRGLPGAETVLRLSFVLAEQLLTDPVARAGVRLTLEGGIPRDPATGLYGDWVGVLGEQFRRATRQLDLRPGVDPDACARFVISSFAGLLMVARALESRGDLPARLREMWEVLIPGVVPPRRCAHYLDLVARLSEGLLISAGLTRAAGSAGAGRRAAATSAATGASCVSR